MYQEFVTTTVIKFNGCQSAASYPLALDVLLYYIVFTDEPNINPVFLNENAFVRVLLFWSSWGKNQNVFVMLLSNNSSDLQAGWELFLQYDSKNWRTCRKEEQTKLCNQINNLNRKRIFRHKWSKSQLELEGESNTYLVWRFENRVFWLVYSSSSSCVRFCQWIFHELMSTES